MSIADHAGRLVRLRLSMRENGIDAVILSVGSDLPYFTGYEAMASERLTALVVRPDREPVMYVPNLEVPRVGIDDFEVVGWDETLDPLPLVATACRGANRIAVGDHMWSVFLLGLQRLLPGVAFTAVSPLTSRLRMVKDGAEVELLRKAAEGVDRVLARLPEEVRFVGRTEVEIARDLRSMTVEEGHDEASFAIVASGPNGASPHHEPGGRAIQTGDLVVCDFGGRLGGYYSDVTRTFSVGAPSAEQAEVHAAVLAANEAGRRSVAPGVGCQEIDRAARSVIEGSGFGDFFTHRTGHGIGLEVHEHPYLVEGNDQRLETGMTFSVEPGIYLPGRFGVRIEDIVACGDDSADDLNRAARDLLLVS